MPEPEDKTICPHCGVKMLKWKTPMLSTWSAEFSMCASTTIALICPGLEPHGKDHAEQMLVPPSIRPHNRGCRSSSRVVRGGGPITDLGRRGGILIKIGKLRGDTRARMNLLAVAGLTGRRFTSFEGRAFSGR